MPGPVEGVSGGCAGGDNRTISWKGLPQPNDYVWKYTVTVTDFTTGQEIIRTDLPTNATELLLSTLMLRMCILLPS